MNDDRSSTLRKVYIYSKLLVNLTSARSNIVKYCNFEAYNTRNKT